MKVFISWSGERSRLVAELLNTWMQCVLQAVDPWLSSKDIDRGSLWFSEITNQLSNMQNGIVCLTKANVNKPWILFESGALAKGLSSNRVYTFLIDLQPNDIKDPLAQFNHTLPTRESIYQLIRTINNSLEDNTGLKENILSNVFDTYWPQFETEFKRIIKESKDEEVVETRPKDDILNEILYSVRGMDKRLRILEEPDITKQGISSRQQTKNDFLQTPIDEFNINTSSIIYLKSIGVKKIIDYYFLSPEKIKGIPERIKLEIDNIIKN